MKRIIGKIDPSDKNVTIYGAGFSGLILAYFLKSEGYKITIHEKSNKVGGKIQTKKVEGGLVEKGANALYLNADGLELLNGWDLPVHRAGSFGFGFDQIKGGTGDHSVLHSQLECLLQNSGVAIVAAVADTIAEES